MRFVLILEQNKTKTRLSKFRIPDYKLSWGYSFLTVFPVQSGCLSTKVKLSTLKSNTVATWQLLLMQEHILPQYIMPRIIDCHKQSSGFSDLDPRSWLMRSGYRLNIVNIMCKISRGWRVIRWLLNTAMEPWNIGCDLDLGRRPMTHTLCTLCECG